MSNPFYARYIPKKTSAVQNHENEVFDNVPEHAVTNASPVKKTKRKRNNADAVKEDNSNLEQAVVETKRNVESLLQGTSKKRKNKEKLSRSPEPADGTRGEDHDKSREIDKDAQLKSLKYKRKRQDISENDEQNAQWLQSNGRGDSAGVPRKHAAILTKFERSIKTSQTKEKSSSPPIETVEQTIVNSLEPLPQPKQPEESIPTYSGLPKWLENPITAEPSATASFDELGIDSEILERLAIHGFEKPSAVQSAVLPLLLPTEHHHPGDLCVSAPTGSGKTLSYVLPIVQSLQRRAITQLRGVIIVPTRELVNQVRQVFDVCVSSKSLRIETASGNQSFKKEQDSLVELEPKYDLDGYLKLRARLGCRIEGYWDKDEATITRVKEDALHQNETIESDDDAEMDDDFKEIAFNLPPGNIPAYTSKCDILICTPGRLVDHIKSTRGFSLADIEWLVIDEADRLLDQSFQEWTTVVLDSLTATSSKPSSNLSVQNPFLADVFEAHNPRSVRKVVLSATMTRDLDKLQALRFRLPKLVLVRGSQVERPDTGRQNEDESIDSLSLPAELEEWAIPVGDGSEKPLYMLCFLQNTIFADEGKRKQSGSLKKNQSLKNEVSGDSDSSSDTSSYISSSSFSSDHSLSNDDVVESQSSDDFEKDARSEVEKQHKPVSQPNRSPQTPRNVLIFVNSNENAARLSRLLTILHTAYTNRLRTLTKGSASKSDSKILASFREGKISIIIASDRASRGLDIPNLTDVVNYDMPRSVSNYVHRVGRTSRAGKSGQCWTFFTESEAWWFWNQVARGPEIGRGGKSVGRSRVDLGDNSTSIKMKYEEALKQLERDVHGDKGLRV